MAIHGQGRGCVGNAGGSVNNQLYLRIEWMERNRIIYQSQQNDTLVRNQGIISFSIYFWKYGVDFCYTATAQMSL